MSKYSIVGTLRYDRKPKRDIEIERLSISAHHMAAEKTSLVSEY